jgi:hypothetical protein
VLGASILPLTFLAWYRIDAPNNSIQRRLLFWLGKESMHLTNQYNAAYFSGLVQNRCTDHTNTTPLTFLTLYQARKVSGVVLLC